MFGVYRTFSDPLYTPQIEHITRLYMKSDTKTQESKESDLKTLYRDALYWHMVHKGHTIRRAELEASVRANR